MLPLNRANRFIPAGAGAGARPPPTSTPPSGSVGPGIGPGVVWTQEQADARFAEDLLTKYGRALNKMLEGVRTTQNQYDAMLSLVYNIGIAGFRGSTVLRKHKAGDYQNAARAFVMWNKNDGKVMRGLTRRRLAEADLYDDPDGG